MALFLGGFGEHLHTKFEPYFVAQEILPYAWDDLGSIYTQNLSRTSSRGKYGYIFGGGVGSIYTQNLNRTSLRRKYGSIFGGGVKNIYFVLVPLGVL